MKIARIEAHNLQNIPIEPPPFRKVPNVEDALLIEIETDDGHIGWSVSGYANPGLVDFLERQVAPVLKGENALLIERVRLKMQKQFGERTLGRVLTNALAAVDIALWDIKGKALGMPVHHLLGGARDKVPVYITHGAAYHGAPIYSEEELAAEAAHLVKLGNRHLKNTVGRQPEGPNPDDDYNRMKAMRDAIGPDIGLAMDGNCRMTAAEAVRLCQITEELNISFCEEPVLENDPLLLAELRSKTRIPIAAAENHKFFARDLLSAGAVDILQPNVNNDGGYTAGIRIAAMARAYNTPIGHGNGNGPHNIALQCGLSNGAMVEYHFHKWMQYNAMFEEVPQPVEGYLTASLKPGLGLDPKPGIIKEYKVKN
jgi:L-rhamnonate dehydratase